MFLWESNVMANTAWVHGHWEVTLTKVLLEVIFSCLSLYPVLNATGTDAFDNVISAINSNIYSGIA